MGNHSHYRLVVHGQPRPYNERQTTKVGKDGKKRTWSYLRTRVKRWKKQIQFEARAQFPGAIHLLKGPVKLKLSFFMKPPEGAKDLPPYPTRKRPTDGKAIDADLTNLVKASEDAIEQIFIENDVDVVDQENRKRWCGAGEGPRIEMEISEL